MIAHNRGRSCNLASDKQRIVPVAASEAFHNYPGDNNADNTVEKIILINACVNAVNIQQALKVIHEVLGKVGPDIVLCSTDVTFTNNVNVIETASSRSRSEVISIHI